MSESEKFEGWAIVEVMGHKRFAGMVSEQTVASTAMVRVDVPDTTAHAGYSKLIGGASIYCITPVVEELARRAAEEIERWSSPIPVVIPVQRQLAAPKAEDAVLVGAESGDAGDEFDPDPDGDDDPRYS